MHTPRRPRAWLGIPLAALAILLTTLLRPGVSTRAQQGMPVETEYDIAYGEAGGQKLLLDVFRPTGQAAKRTRPAVLFVHGGGWAGGDKRDFRDMARGLAGAGYVCFSAGYRLVTPTKNKYPAQIDDVQRAVRWIRANAGKYGVDPRRVGALGASAGGHLVALLGTRDTRDNHDPALARYSSRVACVVDLFGPTDLTAKLPSPPGLDVQALLTSLMGKPLEQARALYRDASPLFHVDGKSSPFLIFHGAEDPLVPLDQSRRFHAALGRAGVASTLIVFQGEGHGFAKPENQARFIRETLAFFNRYLKP